MAGSLLATFSALRDRDPTAGERAALDTFLRAVGAIVAMGGA
jgi:hypothetical protein